MSDNNFIITHTLLQIVSFFMTTEEGEIQPKRKGRVLIESLKTESNVILYTDSVISSRRTQ